MATCDPLQPVVLLTDVMDPNIREIQTVFNSDTEERTTNTSDANWLQVEQTEPLNLCLNGSILNAFDMVEYYSDFKEDGNLSEGSDDDVIFVKEYKVNKESAFKRPNGIKLSTKEVPRRNPVRKARVTKRFMEYTDEGFEENEFLDDSAEDEDSADVAENVATRNEDSEDWNVETMLKRGKQKRKIVSRKMSHKCSRLGRKRKVNQTKTDEKKVPLKELEPLIQCNLLLIKGYIDDVKTFQKITSKGKQNVYEEATSDRSKNALNLLKRQAILLAVTKDIIDGDIPKYL